MNNFEIKNFFAAVKVFLTLAQEDNVSIKKKPILDFEIKILAAFECYKLHASDINTFAENQGEEEEKALGSGDSGIEDNECDNSPQKNFISSEDLAQLSDESYEQAQNDHECAKYLKNKGSRYASQSIFMYQQCLEKTIKSYWLLNPTNVSNLLELRKMSKPGKETKYYQSHDLVLLAKGLSFKEGKLCFFKLQHK